MSRVFQVKPKRLKHSNSTVLTPDMVVTANNHAAHRHPFLEMEPRRCINILISMLL